MQNVPYRIVIMNIIRHNIIHGGKISLIKNPEGFSISQVTAFYKMSFIH